MVKVLSTGRAFPVLTEGAETVLGRENSFLPSEIGVRNCSVQVRGGQRVPRTLRYLSVGKAEWGQSRRVLVASGLLWGQAEMLIWLWALQQELCLSQPLCFGHRGFITDSTGHGHIQKYLSWQSCYLWAFLFSKQYVTRTASFCNINLYNWILKHSGLTESHI